MRLASLIAITGLVGCAPEAELPVEAAQTGAALSVDYFGDTDVVGFHFYVERVACYYGETYPWEHYFASVNLVDGIFPGQIDFIEETLDPSSRHLGADFFVTLSPGCYDVYAYPASAIDDHYDYYYGWKPSYDCTAVHAEKVEVFAEQTTDVVLVSQCKGDPIGALDTLVLLNHPPEFDLEIDEKFNYECEPVRACATITDPDDDPIEVVWEVTPAPFSIDVEDPVIVGFDDGHRIWEACADITTQFTKDYNVNIKVYDVGWGLDDYGNPVQVRLEEIVQEDAIYGSDDYPTSHAELNFPIYTNWIEEPRCIEWEYYDTYHGYGYGDYWVIDLANDGKGIYRAEGCTWTDEETYYCSGAYSHIEDVGDIEDFVCNDDGTLDETALYPDCKDVVKKHGGTH
ncbi:MAG: hypothetical protein KTR31_17625 [Myxococcales bacterium]|nr:hypothetical protein [Myxococcales bacterium]